MFSEVGKPLARYYEAEPAVKGVYFERDKKIDYSDRVRFIRKKDISKL